MAQVAHPQALNGVADCDASPKEMTNTEQVGIAAKKLDGREFSEFINTYCAFLCNIFRRHIIFTGVRTSNKFRGCQIVFPDGNQEAIIDELMPQITEVCEDFLRRKVTPDFLAKIHATHTKHAAKGQHFSVRTTLQYMLANQLRKNKNENIIVKFTDNNNIELFLRNIRRALNGSPPLPPRPSEIRELLRRFRIMLTRLAGEGNTGIYPTPYECFCLYYDCFGRNHQEIIETYVPDPDGRRKIEKMEEWNDEVVGALLSPRYQGATQIVNHRKISCERRTINNRRREYQRYLEDCLVKYIPDVTPAEIKLMLCKRNPTEDDADTIVKLCKQLVDNAGIDRSYSETRTQVRA